MGVRHRGNFIITLHWKRKGPFPIHFHDWTGAARSEEKGAELHARVSLKYGSHGTGVGWHFTKSALFGVKHSTRRHFKEEREEKTDRSN